MWLPLEGRQCGHVHDYCVHEIKFGNVRSPRALARFRLDRSERFPRVAGTGIKVENPRSTTDGLSAVRRRAIDAVRAEDPVRAEFTKDFLG